MSKSAIIPIRFSQEEKYALQQLATEAKLPLSRYIRTTAIKNILKPSKAKSLLNLLDSLNITKEEVEQSDKHAKDFRKNFKLTSTR